MVGWLAYGTLLLSASFMVISGRALGDSAPSIGLQVMGLALIGWARMVFGRRSFHIGSTPTAGGLVTRGPYRFVRHPIYAGVLLAFAGALVAHCDWPALVAAGVGCVSIGARMVSEERQLVARYPEYAAYARRTARLVPRVL